MNAEGQQDKVTDEAVSEQAKDIITDQPPVRNEDEEKVNESSETTV